MAKESTGTTKPAADTKEADASMVKKSDLPASVMSESMRERFEDRFGKETGAVFVSDKKFAQIAAIHSGGAEPQFTRSIAPLDLNGLTGKKREQVATILAEGGGK